MEYRLIKSLNEKVSMLGLGGMRFPMQDGKIDFEKSTELLNYAINNGVNYFDTAYFYHDGDSEIFLGKALQKYNRSDFYIADKLPIWCCEKPEDMQKIFDEQLSRLKTDYIDFYLLHSLDENNFKKCIEFGAYDFLQKKKEEGKIRHIGFSFHDSPEVLEEICKTYKWDFTQIQLNYLDVTLQRAKEQYDILLKYNIPCFVMEPVRGGALANFAPEVNEIFKSANPDVSIASWAIRFAASLDNVYIVLSGMGDVLQVEDNIKTFSPLKKLGDSEYKTIEDAITLYKKLNQIPCTGCRYCMDCAYGVDVPKVFKMFNQFKNTESIHDLKLSVHENINSLPDKCTNCKKCMEHCPQHILIPEELSKINEFIKSRNLLD